MNQIARVFGLTALVFATSSGLVYAQTAEPEIAAAGEVVEGDLPDGWSVLDREVEALGGAEKFLAIKNFVATGVFVMDMMGIEGEIVRTEAAPNKLHMNIQLGAMGAMTQATDGRTAWMIQPGSQSATILEGEMAEQMLEGSDFYSKVQPRERYESAEVNGIEEINGSPCYKLSLVSKAGKGTLAFFDVESGHRVKSMSRSSEDSEVFDAVSEFSDFREVDGIVHAFVMKQKAQGNEFVITFETIEHDVEIDDGIFSPPAEI